jgi:hypothetical protein
MMFALVSLALFLAPDAAAPTYTESCPLALAQVITQALDDYEMEYSELGLLGAAPLPGREPLAVEQPDVVATHSEFDGSAQAAPAAPQPFPLR